MNDTRRRLQLRRAAGDPKNVEANFAVISSMVEPTPTVAFDLGAEGAVSANKRRITVTVTDLLGQRWAGRWLVFVYLATAANGAPDPTGNTVTFNTGTVIETVVPNGAYVVLTDAAGSFTMDVVVAGAATRHVYAAQGLNKPVGSGAVAWA